MHDAKTFDHSNGVPIDMLGVILFFVDPQVSSPINKTNVLLLLKWTNDPIVSVGNLFKSDKISLADASELLSLSEPDILEMIRCGQINALKDADGNYYFSPTNIANLFMKNWN